MVAIDRVRALLWVLAVIQSVEVVLAHSGDLVIVILAIASVVVTAVIGNCSIVIIVIMAIGFSNRSDCIDRGVVPMSWRWQSRSSNCMRRFYWYEAWHLSCSTGGHHGPCLCQDPGKRQRRCFSQRFSEMACMSAATADDETD